MTTGSALDASGLRLVRKGRRVQLGVCEGTVTKANGPRAWVRWVDTRATSYEWCDRLLVVDSKTEGNKS